MRLLLLGRLARLSAVALLLLAGLLNTAHATETTTYVLTDVQGTVIMTEDAHGVTTSQQDYRPYGEPNGSVGPDGPGYTGHVNDPNTGLVYMQARYYDPTIGRFLSVDPIAPVPSNTFNFNRYDYANNNPIVNIDPDGREAGFTYSGDQGMSNFWSKPESDDAIDRAYDQLADGLQAVDELSQPWPDAALEHAVVTPIIAGLRAARVEVKAAQLLENAAKGAAAEAKVAEKLGAKVAGKRVTLEASTGRRSVADLVKKDKSIVEVKSGGARLSPGQKAIKADVEARTRSDPKRAECC